MTWLDMTGQDVTWRDMTWHYVIWHDVTWRAMTWHEVHDVTWCDMTWHDVTWRDMTWHDVTWRDMTWHDVKSRDIMRHDATLRDVTQHDVTHDVRSVSQRNKNELYCMWDGWDIVEKHLNLFRSEAFYRRFIKSAPASIKPKSVQNTDFVTQLGKWISAVPEPFRMKFSTNVEKLFP